MSPTCERILEALRRAPGCTLTTSQLAQPDVGGVRFGGRLHELKHDYGVEIERRRIRDRSWAYTLKSEPPVESSACEQSRAAGCSDALSFGRGLDGDQEAVEVGADSPASPDPGGTTAPSAHAADAEGPQPPALLHSTSDAPGAGDGEVSGSGGELALFEVPPERLPHDQLEDAA